MSLWEPNSLDELVAVYKAELTGTSLLPIYIGIAGMYGFICIETAFNYPFGLF